MRTVFVVAICLSSVLGAAPRTPQLKGNVNAVQSLLDRVLPGSKAHFELAIDDSCTSGTGGAPCYSIEDTPDGKVSLVGTSASELTYGIGQYLREACNMTIGWPRGGNSNVFLPTTWPQAGPKRTVARTQPWSYMMNVCTHSYSLVWYNWEQWTSFIDWMSLSGINLVLAMTGQEEVQYKVFRKFGLNDTEIRSWFNGPALLTWSRGQNEYGSDIAGPLPRSWMQDQWALQRRILARYRELGIVGQLPGFQGNVPVGMKALRKDSNMTDNHKGTAWIDSLNPFFGEVADVWMQTMIEDFGTDHWYQLDGYFDGDTAPWMDTTRRVADVEAGALAVDPASGDAQAPWPRVASGDNCTWGAVVKDSYLAGCSRQCKTFATLADAQHACVDEPTCGGVTLTGRRGQNFTSYQLRAASAPQASPIGETSWPLANAGGPGCHAPAPIVPDPTWVRRGAAAYAGLNRTDPDAVWSFQGWAFVGWKSHEQAQSLRGFIDVTPKDKFVVIDMSVNGEGEWKKWDQSSYWGAPFIWTTLHDFGGTDGMKGNLAQINEIPFAGMEGAVYPVAGGNGTTATGTASSVWGTGFTPEGIDQNPVYYEFIIDQNFRSAPVADLAAHAVSRAHRRYAMRDTSADVTEAWQLLVQSAYAQDLSVQDHTAVAHLPGSSSQFEADRFTSTPTLCKIFGAWRKLVAAADKGEADASLPTFRYDMVNLGRELLAQLSVPVSLNLTDAMGLTSQSGKVDAARTEEVGRTYAQLLRDIDALVGTEPAFLLGPWIEQARYWGRNQTGDCANAWGVATCADFYEWNARVQLTSWNPTPKGAAKVPGGPIDYASKHWSGLISDYYAKRAELLVARALQDGDGKALNRTAQDAVRAAHSYTWAVATNKYPTAPVGDALAVSKAMLAKYAPYYASCQC